MSMGWTEPEMPEKDYGVSILSSFPPTTLRWKVISTGSNFPKMKSGSQVE